MSAFAIHNSEYANVPAKNTDWRKQVDELQKIMTAQAPILLASLKQGNAQSVRDAIEQGPVIFGKLQELEKLQQSRLEDIDRCHEQWLSAVSERTCELRDLDERVKQQRTEVGDLNQDIKQQEEKVDRVGRELASLVNQRMNASEKLATIKEKSNQHEQLVVQEDRRLDGRSAALDERQRQLEAREADVTNANAILLHDLETLQTRQVEELRREEENKRKTARINRRFDVLADYRVHKDRQVAESASKVEELRMENGGLKDAKNNLEGRVVSLQQEVTSLKSNAAGLEGTIRRQTRQVAEFASRVENLKKENTGLTDSKVTLQQDITRLKSDGADMERTIRSQNAELSKLRPTEAEKAKLNSSLIYLTGVLLPQKEAELTNSRAELAKLKEHANALEKDLTGSIAELNARVLDLESQVEQQINQLSQIDGEKASLQLVADQRSSQAQSTETKLAIAQATINSLNSEIDQFRKRDVELQAEVHQCKSNHSDIGSIRRQLSDLQKEADRLRPCKIDFDAAKRIQDSSNAKIHDLEQERNDIVQQRDQIEQERSQVERERNDIQEQLQNVWGRLNRANEEARKNLDQHAEASAKDSQTIERLRRRCHDTEVARDQLITDNDALRVQSANLITVNGRLEREKHDLSNELEETEIELERLAEMQQSCHCAGRRSSRKRSHDLVDPEEEELSSVDEYGWTVRRLGKAPESTANVNAAGQSGSEIAVGGSVSPVLSISRVAETPCPAGTDTSRSGLMNTTAPRALGTINPTITPSDSAAFTVSVKDVKLQNFSSDVLPLEVLETLQRRFRVWNADSGFWSKVKSQGTGQNCIESRMDKKRSKWVDGPEYACTWCEKGMRMCMVFDGGERVLLLPRKAAANEGDNPRDPRYWMK